MPSAKNHTSPFRSSPEWLSQSSNWIYHILGLGPHCKGQTYHFGYRSNNSSRSPLLPCDYICCSCCKPARNCDRGSANVPSVPVHAPYQLGKQSYPKLPEYGLQHHIYSPAAALLHLTHQSRCRCLRSGRNL